MTGDPTPIRSRERDFEKFCQEHGVSGVLMWCETDAPPGARPKSGCQLALAPQGERGHRIAFANGALTRLADFRQWLLGLMAAR